MLAVPEQLSDQGQVLARHNGLAGHGVAEVVNRIIPRPASLRTARQPADWGDGIGAPRLVVGTTGENSLKTTEAKML